MVDMIALYTDFGIMDPYVGQMHAAIARVAPELRVIDLFHSVPCFDVRAGAYLLPAYASALPEGAVLIGVVDPGVGGARAAVMVRADGRWYVGPDNGLFHIVARRAHELECRVVRWRPPRLSESFHGRDLFAPVAARLARGELPESEVASLTPPEGDWPDDLAQVLYVDHYGNAVTGLRAGVLRREQHLLVHGRRLAYARVFADVPRGQAFWYENANGLVEIAAHSANAAQRLGLRPGDAVTPES